jgi:hypothetical protein
MSNGKLSKEDEEKAKELHKKFFKQYPSIKNPSDLNNKAKVDFSKTITTEELRLMQRVRKFGSAAYPFTKEDSFKNNV